MQGFWYLLQFYFINFLHLKNMNLKDVKNRLKEELLDLSLCDLKEVPVREIATIKRATQLDLSNNLLTFLPSNFVDLKHIVKLDLSKNMLTEIPVNFGELRQLKHLDLYANQISRLPLSLSELKHLRWLDLKENPLTPAVASVAGPCSNLSECQACARNIVAYLSQVKLTIEEEKLRRLNKATINDAETDTDIASTRKGGKRKKKKSLDKKQDSDTCKFNSSNERSQMDENKIIDSTLTGCKNQAHKEYIFKENPFRLFMSMVLWVSFFGLAFVLTIMILLSYSKQSELVTNYIGKDMGIRLKEFQKHCINIFYVFVQAINNIVDNLYYVYQSNFKTDANIPIKT